MWDLPGLGIEPTSLTLVVDSIHSTTREVPALWFFDAQITEVSNREENFPGWAKAREMALDSGLRSEFRKKLWLMIASTSTCPGLQGCASWCSEFCPGQNLRLIFPFNTLESSSNQSLRTPLGFSISNPHHPTNDDQSPPWCYHLQEIKTPCVWT